MAELAEQLRRYQHEYFVLGRPSVTDAVFDALFDRLIELEHEHPEWAAPDSPTRRVGSDLSNDLEEVPHTIPVLSLDKAYTPDEVEAWMRKTAQASGRPLGFVLEEKIDGASLVLYYRRGLLERAVTRGNGLVGNDVTANVRTIGAVPLKLERDLDIAVRGEVFMPRPLFQRINAALESPYANPRNFAAGTLRRVKSAEVARIPLDIFIYEGHWATPPRTHVEVLETLEELGFRLDPRIGYFADGSPDIAAAVAQRHPGWIVGPTAEFHRYLECERSDRQGLPYDIDGLVIKVDEIDARQALGATGHHPRWSLAFKFDAPEAVSVVIGIDVQVGRTGRITPVARIEPVRISGSTVSNATLHNQEYVDLLELAVGDTVAISKRGDVIPAVERVVEKNLGPDGSSNTTWKMPAACPSCATGLVDVGAHRFCPNLECPAQVRGRLNFFAARGQMDIENLGPETIDVLLERGLIHDLPDIYDMDPQELLGVPGFGPKKVASIRQGIAASRARPYRAVLVALGIPELGQKVTELLIGAGYRSMDDLLRIADAGDPAPLLAVHGIGEKTAERILRELSDPAVRRRVERLRSAGLVFVEAARDEPPAHGALGGTIWCVTGTFQQFVPRERAAEEIRSRGGQITTAVSKRTTHLLAGRNAGSKLARARELGVTVVDEAELLGMLSL
jgi:DNA ligase (NAD+)